MLSIEINNGQKLVLKQNKHDKSHEISIFTTSPKQDGTFDVNNVSIIPEYEFVMLYNLYRYVKDNNVKNAWINPNGERIEDLT